MKTYKRIFGLLFVFFVLFYSKSFFFEFHFNIATSDILKLNKKTVYATGITKRQVFDQNLRSILKQDVVPPMIILTYSENDFTPEEVNYLWKLVHKEIKINNVNEMKTQILIVEGKNEWHSASKLLGALDYLDKNNLSDYEYIVYGDDDKVYFSSWYRNLLVAALTYPETVLGYRGWRVRDDFTFGVSQKNDGVWGTFPILALYVVESFNLKSPYKVSVVTGTGGVIAPRKVFKNRLVFNDDFSVPEEYLHVDDIWINGVLAKQNVPRLIFPAICGDSIHLGQNKPAIEGKLKGKTRYSLNHKVIKHFEFFWEPELLYNVDDPYDKKFSYPNYHLLFEVRVRLSNMIRWLYGI